MTTRELIERLSDLDPEGNDEVYVYEKSWEGERGDEIQKIERGSWGHGIVYVNEILIYHF